MKKIPLPATTDVVGVAGAAAVIIGIAQIYAPAAWICGGLMALAVAGLAALREATRGGRT